MKLLDLFCKAGGATRGYQQAGFYVVGVDIEPQPHYVGDRFILGDALEVLAGMIESGEIEEFDLIAASPPCQLFSVATPMQYRDNHPDLIDPIRQLLRATGKPYVIENVAGAVKKLINPIMLCGTMFGLPIWRHRYFEVWPEIFALLPPCAHIGRPVLITGMGSKRDENGNRYKRISTEIKRQAIEIDWMNRDELSEAIPPAYTRWLGEKILESIQVEA